MKKIITLLLSLLSVALSYGQIYNTLSWGDAQILGGLKIDSTGRQLPGLIRFANGRFQGYNGTSWLNLDSTTFSTGNLGDVQLSDGSGGFLNSNLLAGGTKFNWDGLELDIANSNGGSFYFDGIDWYVDFASGNYMYVSPDDNFYNLFMEDGAGNNAGILIREKEIVNSYYSANGLNDAWFELDAGRGTGLDAGREIFVYNGKQRIEDEANLTNTRNWRLSLYNNNLGDQSRDYIYLDSNRFKIGFDNNDMLTLDHQNLYLDEAEQGNYFYVQLDPNNPYLDMYASDTTDNFSSWYFSLTKFGPSMGAQNDLDSIEYIQSERSINPAGLNNEYYTYIYEFGNKKWKDYAGISLEPVDPNYGTVNNHGAKLYYDTNNLTSIADPDINNVQVWHDYIRMNLNSQTALEVNDSNVSIDRDLYIDGKFIRFNESEGMFEFGTGINDVIWQGGLEDLVLIYNNNPDTLLNGKPFRFTGSIGDSVPTVGYVSADSPFAKTVRGLITSSIPPNSYGFGCVRGYVRDFNTSNLSQIGAVYLSADTGLTNTAPAYPADKIVIGGLIRSDNDSGIVYVNVDLGFQRTLEGKSYTFSSQGISSGTYYKSGFYRSASSSVTLTQASPTVTFGSAGVAYSAHPFIVCGGAGTVNTGTVGLRVTGRSVDDLGNNVAADPDTILLDITGVALNEYYEAKKYTGTVTFELITITGAPTTYSLTINYGTAKYEDLGNRNFYIYGSEVVGLAAANDPNFNIELLHHKSTGWTYAATGFIPGNSSIATWSNDLTPNDNLGNGLPFSWKRTNLNTYIKGTESEGFLYRITTGANNSVQTMDMHVSAAVD